MDGHLWFLGDPRVKRYGSTGLLLAGTGPPKERQKNNESRMHENKSSLDQQPTLLHPRSAESIRAREKQILITWERRVPLVIAEIVKRDRLFGHPGEPKAGAD